MAVRGHPYRDGTAGRSITTRPGVGGMTITAHLECSKCGKIGHVKCRAIMPPEQIDRKFRQAGWRLDPHVCPDCIPATHEKKGERRMASKPSPAAMKAQAAMFQLLAQHFDTDTGRYAKGWSDAKIAKETGISPDMVRDFRVAGFGDLREPEEVVQLRSDIDALATLQREQNAAITVELETLRSKLDRIAKAAA